MENEIITKELVQGSTIAAADTISKVSYSHRAMVDYIIANPRCTNRDLATHFDYSEAWISRVKNSDAFNEVLADRRKELHDPVIVATIKENLQSVAQRSMESVMSKLNGPHRLEDALRAMEISTRSLGYGSNTGNNTTINTNFVVALPDVAKTSKEWIEGYATREKEV